jgi:hypothetical protein
MKTSYQENQIVESDDDEWIDDFDENQNKIVDSNLKHIGEGRSNAEF